MSVYCYCPTACWNQTAVSWAAGPFSAARDWRIMKTWDSICWSESSSTNIWTSINTTTLLPTTHLLAACVSLRPGGDLWFPTSCDSWAPAGAWARSRRAGSVEIFFNPQQRVSRRGEKILTQMREFPAHGSRSGMEPGHGRGLKDYSAGWMFCVMKMTDHPWCHGRLDLIICLHFQLEYRKWDLRLSKEYWCFFHWHK